MSSYRTRRVPLRDPQQPAGFRYPVSRESRHHGYDSYHFYNSHDFSRKVHNYSFRIEADVGPPSFKRRRSSYFTWNDGGGHYQPYQIQQVGMIGNAPSTSSYGVYSSEKRIDARGSCNSEQSRLEDETEFMSRYEIERCSPSRRDGIDLHKETFLRHSYCAFLQDLGIRIEVPQTTIGTAMVLCHRFFVRRSHASHDRFLMATAALFLAAKSEETPRPLNTVVRLSYEICHKQDLAFFPRMLPVDWFEQYKERVLEAEHMILITLDFELGVQHPYNPLTSVLSKLGLSQSSLVGLAWNLVNEGLRSSLWLQFKPHHIAAGAAVLAAKILNLDLSFYPTMWQEFQTTPDVVHDIVKQLMELF